MTDKHKYNLERWRLLIQDQKNSGMTIIEWCRQNGHSKDEYYYWLRQLRHEALPLALNQMNFQDNNHELVDVTPQLTRKDYSCSDKPSAVIKKYGIEIELFESSSGVFMQKLIESVLRA